MSEQSAKQLLLPSISSAAASPVPTYRARAIDLASAALRAACGPNSLESLKSAARAGLSSKTSQAAPRNGSTKCVEDWGGVAMRRFRSRLAQWIAAQDTGAPESSLLPTLTANRYGSTNNGHPRDGKREHYATKGTPSLDTLAGRLGGSLSPTWCEWFMGFPEDWTSLGAEQWAIVSCRNVPKSSGT